MFTTYDERPVNPCNDPLQIYYSPEEQANCNFTQTNVNGTSFNSQNSQYSEVDIGLIYNDVWAYKVCNTSSIPPERGFDTACEDTGWVLWHPGALQGGCVIELGIEVWIYYTL